MTEGSVSLNLQLKQEALTIRFSDIYLWLKITVRDNAFRPNKSRGGGCSQILLPGTDSHFIPHASIRVH